MFRTVATRRASFGGQSACAPFALIPITVVVWLLSITFVSAAVQADPADPLAVRLDAFGDPLPPGAVLRLGTVRLRFDHSADPLTFSPDGKEFMALDGDVLRFFDSADGKPLRVVRPQRATGITLHPVAACLSPDGEIVAQAQKALIFCDPKTGVVRREKPLAEINDTFSHHGLYVSANGKYLASPSKQLHLGPIEGDTPLQLITPAHGDYVVSATFSAAGSLAATIGADSTVRVWDPSTGRPVSAMVAGVGEHTSISLSPDGKLLAAGADGRVKFFDPRTGQLLDPPPLVVPPLDQPALPSDGQEGVCVSFSPKPAPSGGPALAVWAAGKIRLFDLTPGKLLSTFSTTRDRDPRDGRMGWSADGKKLAASEWLPVVDLFDVDTGKSAVNSPALLGPAYAVAISPDGATISTAARFGALQHWDSATGRLLPSAAAPRYEGAETLEPYSSRVQELTYAADGTLWRKAASLTAIDTATGGCRGGFVSQVRMASQAVISPDRPLAAILAAGKITIWDIAVGKRRLLIDTTRKKAASGSLPSLAFGPDGLLAVATDDAVVLCDATTGKIIRQLKDDAGPPTWVRLSRNGRRVATGSAKGIAIWALPEGKVISRFKGLVGNNLQMELSPAGDLFLMTAWGLRSSPTPQKIEIWDVASGETVSSLTPTYAEATTQVRFTPTGRRFVTTALDAGGALVWDVGVALGPDPEWPAKFPRLLLDTLYKQLDDADPKAAYRAIAGLADRPAEAVNLIKERLVDAPGERRAGRAAIALLWAGTPESAKLIADLAVDAAAPPAVRSAMAAVQPLTTRPPRFEMKWRGEFIDPVSTAVEANPAPREAPSPVAAPSDEDLARLDAGTLALWTKFYEYGDPRLPERALRWLDEETKPPLRATSPRLSAAYTILVNYRLTQAVPNLIRLYDRDDLDATVRAEILRVIARIGGKESTAFARKHFSDASLPDAMRVDLAGPLAAEGDSAATELLISSYARTLQQSAGRRTQMMGSIQIAMRGMRDSKLADQMLVVGRTVGTTQAMGETLFTAETIRCRGLAEKDLLDRLADHDPLRQCSAIVALGQVGGLGAIEALQSAEYHVPPRRPSTRPASGPATAPASPTEPAFATHPTNTAEPDHPATGPATRPATMPASPRIIVSEKEFRYLVTTAQAEIRRRHWQELLKGGK